MNQVFLEYGKLPGELRILLDISLQQTVRVPEEIDWDYFDKLVSQHRIQPLLIRGLRTLGGDCPQELAKYRLQQSRYVKQSMDRIQALAAINAAFSDAGIHMISMKGPMLAMELYGDPSLRTSRDLDLMVAQEDLDRAEEVLTGMGYMLEQHAYTKTPLRRKYYGMLQHEKHRVYVRNEICVEVHWRSDYQREQSFCELWSRREERQLLGRAIALMGHDDRIPALIIHAAEHGFLRLRWLLDLYELQKKPGFSWERAYELMDAQGLGAVLLETMLVMQRLDLPGMTDVNCKYFHLSRSEVGIRLEAKESDRAAQLSNAVFPLIQRAVKSTEAEWKTYDRLMPSEVYGKTAFQWFLTFVGPAEYDYGLIDLPDWLFWLYFIIRPINWVWRKLFGGKR